MPWSRVLLTAMGRELGRGTKGRGPVLSLADDLEPFGL